MIKVGDIVKTKNKEGKAVLPAVVTKIYPVDDKNVDVNVLFEDGTYGYRTAKKITETGRHIDMQGILDSIK